MIHSLTLPEEQAQIAAQQLVCSYLVRACREAMYELALDDLSESHVRREAIRLFKTIHEDWLEARKALVDLVSEPDVLSHPFPADADQSVAFTIDNK